MWFKLIQSNLLLFIKWEDTIKSITQVYLQQIRKKNTNNYKKTSKTVTCILLSVKKKKYIQLIKIFK